MKYTKSLLLFIAFVFCGYSLSAKQIELNSPNGKINLQINIKDKIYYTISSENKALLQDNYLQMTVNGQVLGENPKLAKVQKNNIDEVLKPIVPLKQSEVRNNYNKALLSFKGNYQVEFRVFDEGVAYRFITAGKGEVEVANEIFGINLPLNSKLHMQQPGSFKTAYEEHYTHLDTKDWNNKMALLPLLVDTQEGYKILISESDLSDYPCMFLKSEGNGVVKSVFPKAPLKFGEDGDRSLKILEEANYIAKTQATRSFPWRYFMIASNDKQIVENTMTYKLATKNQLEDTSWLHPGQVSWEWWNGAAPYGPDVNFVSGYNQATYKYYIDFAAKQGISYIIMDEGWANTTLDPFTPNKTIDLHEIIRHGNEKNVGVVLWLTWLAVENNFEIFETFSKWGVKGVKIDFMDRSDQWMVNYYERVAKEAAKHNIFVLFHGAFKPAGLEYAYPNVLTYEGVRGMEQMDGCKPDNSLYLPFIRNAVGAMDYTPGAMISMQPEVYSGRRPNSASIGTRAYQLALFVVFESGIQMLADSPTMYYRNQECTDFLTQVPTIWDETIALEASVGEYVIVAKRKGEKWYIGAITNGKEKIREFEISLDFLKKNKSYKMEAFSDGINAGHQAMDYRRTVSTVNSGEKVQIKMHRNGGWAAVIE